MIPSSFKPLLSSAYVACAVVKPSPTPIWLSSAVRSASTTNQTRGEIMVLRTQCRAKIALIFETLSHLKFEK